MSRKKPSPLVDYAGLLGRIKDRIRQAQARAVLAANGEMIRLYWDVGDILVERQARRVTARPSSPGWHAISAMNSPR